MVNNLYFKEFAKYAALNVLGMLGLSCYILADTFFIVKGLGADGIAALNLAIPVYSFIHGTGLMLGIGGSTKYSIYQGIKNIKKQIYYLQIHYIWGLCLLLYLYLRAFFYPKALRFC